MAEQPTPVANDAHATPAQLLARAAQDYEQAHPQQPDDDR